MNLCHHQSSTQGHRGGYVAPSTTMTGHKQASEHIVHHIGLTMERKMSSTNTQVPVAVHALLSFWPNLAYCVGHVDPLVLWVPHSYPVQPCVQ